MSNPANRLATARSYSYYHVLTVCDCSATAYALSLSQTNDVWEHTTNQTAAGDSRANTTDLGKYAPKQMVGAGKYCVLINGATDAAFVITNAKWSSATAASAVPKDRSTSIAVEGSMQVSEPRGIAFLDQVIKCCVALGVDASQAVFVLKTFFITHSYDATQGEYNDFISDIPPLNFIAYDVTGSFTEAGGSYDIQFVAVGHGAARLPQYGKAVNAMNLTAGDSLEETFKRLQTNINDNYDRYFDCVYQQIKQAGGGPETEKLLQSLCKVKYVIDVGNDYKDSNGQINYTVSNQMQQFKNTAGCSDAAQINFPASSSIENAISTIMMMSPRVQQDMSQGDASSKIKYEYKIHTALESKPVEGGTDNKLEYTVYYRVERFMTPKTIAYDSSFQTLAQDSDVQSRDPNYEMLRRNIIEFDYLYTGKNIDIIDFDMKINMGMAYLQTATLANTFKSQLERGANRQMQASTQDVNNQGVRFGGALVQTPVFFGTQITASPLINQQNAGNAIQSAYTLTKHASLEVTEAAMTIIGNTQLLGSTNAVTSPEKIREGADRETYEGGGTDYPDWSYVPSYAKVNIKMPRTNDDFELYTGQSASNPQASDSTDYARDFWFDGYYYVYGIEHNFDQGQFTQTLQMIGIPKKSAFDATKDNSTREVDMSNAVGQCFDNHIGVGVSTASTTTAIDTNAPDVAVPEVPPAGTTAPTTKADADVVNSKAGDPSNVRGWNKASEAVKSAIRNASSRYGVDIVIMAQFAAKESSFIATAHPKGSVSSAAGLYQFLKDTWNGLVLQGAIVGVTKEKGLVTTKGKTPSATDPRYDPQLNAYAGAAFIKDNARTIGSNDAGDLYLAHFLGPATAKKVVADCNRTGGNTLLSTVLGSDQTNKIAKANPTIVNSKTTSLQIRTWAATSMAKLLTNQTAVASKKPPEASAAARTADQPLAAVQNSTVQAAKSEINPCGPTADTVGTADTTTNTTQGTNQSVIPGPTQYTQTQA